MAPCTPNGQMLAQPDPRPSLVNSAAELNRSDGEALSFLLQDEISQDRQPETSEKATLPKWTIGWWTPLLLVGFYCFGEQSYPYRVFVLCKRLGVLIAT